MDARPRPLRPVDSIGELRGAEIDQPAPLQAPVLAVLECTVLPFGRDPSGGSRVKPFDFLPPDARINQHRNAPSAAADLRHRLTLVVGGEVPELLLELLGGEWAQPVPGKDLVYRHRDRRLQGDATVFV